VGTSHSPLVSRGLAEPSGYPPGGGGPTPPWWLFPPPPPLPTAWNFPFQARAGSQTSILMSESGEGLTVAATRQKAGRRLNCCVAAGLIPGTVKPPAGTIWAKVIEVFGSFRDDNFSHDGAASRVCPYIIVARSAQNPPVTILITPSSEVLTQPPWCVLTHTKVLGLSPPNAGVTGRRVAKEILQVRRPIN